MHFILLNADQARETVNTRQRFEAWRDASARLAAFKGSMVWSRTNGQDYLLRSAYDRSGRRKQVSLGPRTAETERLKADYDRDHAKSDENIQQLKPIMARQAAVNRALGLGRVPLIGARIMRALEANRLLGHGIRVVGTNAILAYEAASGVHFDAGLTTTEDIDLLFDSRSRLSFIADDDVKDASLLRILQRADTSFERTKIPFRAVNRDGYIVDLIKPLREPPWAMDTTTIGDDPVDLSAVEIVGLQWLESAASFEATAIDARGEPLRIVTIDPRVFAAHKLWLSDRDDRDPLKRRRDREQARAVASLVATQLAHLPYAANELRILPKVVFEAARPFFELSDP